jgi:hypothetical protein
MLATVDLADIDEAISNARASMRSASCPEHRAACERYLDELLDQRGGSGPR